MDTAQLSPLRPARPLPFGSTIRITTAERTFGCGRAAGSCISIKNNHRVLLTPVGWVKPDRNAATVSGTRQGAFPGQSARMFAPEPIIVIVTVLYISSPKSRISNGQLTR